VRPALSVVIPVYNEPIWITRCVRAVLAGAAGSTWDVQVVDVDDGSTDSTPEVLEQLAAEHGIVVVSQPNGGRLAARTAGILRATGEHVLLLDSRVILRPSALPWLAGMLADEPLRRVWNGHVHVVTTGNPYNGFWAGLVAVAWRRYLADPRLTSFGAEDFDAFPKGTSCFFAPRATSA
jgi:glycosyltransferase involved in cell wall biosynthesis